jgi:hypothetical protein
MRGCVDLQSDHNNCGTCGNGQGLDELCCKGILTQHSTTNCAACGNLCLLNDLCCNETAQWTCIGQDKNNCGGCGHSCATDAGSLQCCGCGPLLSCSTICPACPL